MFKFLFLAVSIIAHEPGYYTSLAKHVQRWLAGEKVPAQVTTPQGMSVALAKEKVAVLVGFENPTKTEIATLTAFRNRGGKLIVFHSSSPALGDLMGVKPVGYRAAAYPGEWSRMNFNVKGIDGLPASILQTSTVLHRAVPVKGRGRVLATWSDRAGRSGGEPAWIATGAGYWMTHVLLADGDEALKARMLGAMVGSLQPGSWSFAAHQAREGAKAKALKEYALAQTPAAGEIHAVWDHSGCGLYPGNWPRTISLLKAAHVTDLFVNVAGAGFAHYASNVLPRSKTFREEGDQLAACLEAAKWSNVRVHAWILCFSATRAGNDVLALYQKRGWRLKNAKTGKLTDYVDPANPAVRAHVLAAVDELQARYPVAGIHLDFVRWGEGTARPANAAESVTRFVNDAKRRVKRPKWLTAAVYGKYPQCVNAVGQDWYSWLDVGAVDYVVPMDYTESPIKFAELLTIQAMPRSHARKTIVGIGVTANESRLDAKGVIDQLKLVRRFGFAGASLFDLDVTLEKEILPYLKLGVWRQ